jgi:uncharacterized protein YbjT (DUF2867 family)
MILVTGASGTVGSAVLRAVAASGTACRALYRSASDAAAAPDGVTPVVADFARPDSLPAALAGIESLFLVCGPVPDLVVLETNMIDAAEAAGIRRIVLNSALGAGDWDKSFPSWHRRVEDRLRAGPLASCILRPNSFMQNTVTYFAPGIRAEGAFYGAMGAARTSYVDVDDIAAVAAAALVDASHDGQTYELNGPEALTQDAVAAIIEHHAGRPVRYVDIPVEAQRQAMLGQGMPGWQVDALLDLQAYYTSGRGGVTDGVLAGLLGRPPMTLDRFVAAHAAAFRATP